MSNFVARSIFPQTHNRAGCEIGMKIPHFNVSQRFSSSSIRSAWRIIPPPELIIASFLSTLLNAPTCFPSLLFSLRSERRVRLQLDNASSQRAKKELADCISAAFSTRRGKENQPRLAVTLAKGTDRRARGRTGAGGRAGG